jgi:hypothetical protein
MGTIDWSLFENDFFDEEDADNQDEAHASDVEQPESSPTSSSIQPRSNALACRTPDELKQVNFVGLPLIFQRVLLLYYHVLYFF